jgi:hypothetical protein
MDWAALPSQLQPCACRRLQNAFDHVVGANLPLIVSRDSEPLHLNTEKDVYHVRNPNASLDLQIVVGTLIVVSTHLTCRTQRLVLNQGLFDLGSPLQSEATFFHTRSPYEAAKVYAQT